MTNICIKQATSIHFPKGIRICGGFNACRSVGHLKIKTQIINR